ncbi:MAG TPA: serine hydrolase domain-containing protein [Myxococcota bacterium]|nr:serine hydrolase domain-containing protein [Myxococcota bacterium]
MVLPVDERFAPARGFIAEGYEGVARTFATQLASGAQTGASFAVYRRGELVVDLWGGLADTKSGRPWERETRIVLFSVTKGFAAMAFHLLADRGLIAFDAPVAQYWPGFAKNGKESMTVGTLLGHRGGLAQVDTKMTIADYLDPSKRDFVVDALEKQAPAWTPGTDQGYHAITFGLYARELFERIAGEDMGSFLRRELFAPLGSDIYLGTPESEDHRVATLYPPATTERVTNMIGRAMTEPSSAEARVFKAVLKKDSDARRAFTNPSTPKNDLTAYNKVPARRHNLAWASATGSAHGVARAYLPFATNGTFAGRQYLGKNIVTSIYRRDGWSDRDRVLQKPLGWTNGFLKEERHVFCPNPESFGHAGMGGSLGWCDPTEELTLGYALNKMDWRVRSLRALELCHALYDCEAMSAPRMV